MLMLNNFSGFGVAPAAAGGTVQTLVDRTTGTTIGNMTTYGGLAAAFDGTTSQAMASSCSINAGDRTTGYVGKDWGSGNTKLISGIRVYGPSDNSIDQLHSGTSTIELQGSTDNFSSSIVSLWANNFTDGSALVLTYLSGFTVTTAYRYHRIKVTSSSGSTATDNKSVAELQFYEEL